MKFCDRNSDNALQGYADKYIQAIYFQASCLQSWLKIYEM